MARYSKERKEAVLRKMLPPMSKSIAEISREEGISEATLYNWRKQARAQGRLLPDSDTLASEWTAQDKFLAVLETAAMSEAEKSEYCRRRGIYLEELQRWRIACEEANGWDEGKKRQLETESKAQKDRLKKLERELRRKEKALAEAAALLVLKKKLDEMYGGGES